MPGPLERRPSENQYQHDPGLAADSYTTLRLSHATPEHLYLTSRRLFIGPIPEGWLRSHRKDWYKRHLGLRYSSRQPSFRASDNVTRQKRVTGIDGVSARPQSFPQPEDAIIDEEDDTGAGAERDQEVTTEVPPAIEAPRATNPNEEVPQRDRPKSEEDPISEGVQSLDGTDSTRDLKASDSHAKSQGKSTDATYTTAREHHAGNSEVGASVDFAKVQSQNSPEVSSEEGQAASQNRVSSVPSQYGVNGITASEPAGPSTSTTALVPQAPEPDPNADPKTDQQERPSSGSKALMSKVKRSIRKSSDEPGTTVQDAIESAERHRKRSTIHFSLPGEEVADQLVMKARLTQLDLQHVSSKVLTMRRRLTDGQVIKTERMLVRVETTLEPKLPDDYDENSSQGVVTQMAEPFREYMIVCRQSSRTEGADFVLQMYKTRVIPAIDASEDRKHATHIVPLGRKIAHVNLYSALDKTVALWVPHGRGTQIFILRSRSAADSVEWYTFLRNILGWHRPSEIQVNVPDFSISLRIAHPFQDLEALQDVEQDEDAENEEDLRQAMEQQELAATKITQRCLKMLEASPEWKDVLPAWAKGKRIGLAWKRYDRLEWIHGANERKMYGTMAMMRSHDLELRPKEHYPTSTLTRKEQHLTEPAPIEGFLIRLTSHKGVQQRMGKMFFKRLYFATFDHYLVFSRPSKADPPPPPRIPTTDSKKIPNAHQMAEKIPIIYSVNPYPVEHNQIRWLIPGRERPEEKRHKDEDAFDETTRKVKNLLDCDGFIDLVNVVRVRHMHRGATPADETIDEGSDVDYDIDVPNTRADDGKTDRIDDHRSFELVLNNRLVIRLQAFDEETKKEWIKRLRDLVHYWKYRHSADMELYKAVRHQNLETLQIDEETEAIVGQYARKWEVTKTYASPELYNMCGISCCRTIHLSGPLYRKPKRHSLFAAVHCILVPGRVLLFSQTLRERSGRSIPSIHNDKMDSIDLSDCYLYSGLLTENDLLYQNQTFDSNNPGHNALPRMWLEDAWTSRDEDAMTTFVIWQPRSKGWFRQPEASSSDADDEKMKTKLKRVANLGKKGRTIVFKARSRAERDHWVLAIGAEIERLQGGEDVRIITERQKRRRAAKKST